MTRYVILECETDMFEGAPWRSDEVHFGYPLAMIEIDKRGGRRGRDQIEDVMVGLIRKAANGRRPIDALVKAGFDTGIMGVNDWMRSVEAKHPELKVWGIAAAIQSPLFAYAAVEIPTGWQRNNADEADADFVMG